MSRAPLDISYSSSHLTFNSPSSSPQTSLIYAKKQKIYKVQQSKYVSHIDTTKNEYEEKSQLSMIHETISSNSRTLENSIIPKRPNDNNKYLKFVNQQFKDSQISSTEKGFSGIKGANDGNSRTSSQNQMLFLQENNNDFFNPFKMPYQNSSRGLLGSAQNINGKLKGKRQSRISAIIKMLNDREKFIFAKTHQNIDLLLELITSNDPVQHCNSQNKSSMISCNLKRTPNRISNDLNSSHHTYYYNQSQSNQQVPQSGQQQNQSHCNSFMTTSNNQAGELRSDLRKDWMDYEQLISHCALNQLSYLILQKRKELKLHMFYNLADQNEKMRELLEIRQAIFRNFEDHKTIEKRIQKYLLMADDTGMQCSLYLLFVLSDDEIKGYQNCTSEKIQEIRASLSSSSSQSDLITQSKLSSSKKQRKNKYKLNSQFKSGWFKKFINNIITSLDCVLNDMCFSLNTVRISILLFQNLCILSKSLTKSYLRKKQTYQKFLNFFDRERMNFMDEELKELEKSLLAFYSQREVYALLRRSYHKHQQIASKINKDAQVQEVLFQKDHMFKPQQSRLIRSDSSESLMEIIRTEKQYQSLLSGQFNLSHSNNQTLEGSLPKKLDSYEFRMLADDGRMFLDQGDILRLRNENGKIIEAIRKTSSVGPEMQKYLLQNLNSSNELNKGNGNINLNFLNDNLVESTCLESNGRIVRNEMVDTVIDQQMPTIQQHNQNNYRHQQYIAHSKQPSSYSQRSKANFQNDSQYWQTKDSKFGGETAMDQTFLELKESFFLKDRSFYQKFKQQQLQQSQHHQNDHPHSKESNSNSNNNNNGYLQFNNLYATSSLYSNTHSNFNIKSPLIGQNSRKKDSEQSMAKNQDTKNLNNRQKVIITSHYEDLELKLSRNSARNNNNIQASLEQSSQSQFGTKLLNSRNFTNQNIFGQSSSIIANNRKQGGYQMPSQSSCCILFGGSGNDKKSKKNKIKKKKDQIMSNQVYYEEVQQQQMTQNSNTKSFKRNSIVESSFLKENALDLIRTNNNNYNSSNSILVVKKSQIYGKYCPHNVNIFNGEVCHRCTSSVNVNLENRASAEYMIQSLKKQSGKDQKHRKNKHANINTNHLNNKNKSDCNIF